MKKFSVVSVFALLVIMSVPSAGYASQYSQEEAYQRVQQFTPGRARPSRRSLKASVREVMNNAADSFNDYKLEIRFSQQRQTERELNAAKLERVLELKSKQPLDSKRGDLTRRMRSRIQDAASSSAIDTSVCSGMHLKARLGCLVKLRRDHRIEMLRLRDLQLQSQTSQ